MGVRRWSRFIRASSAHDPCAGPVRPQAPGRGTVAAWSDGAGDVL